ncbi:hypothetical protein GCM10010123_45700 [Pilimelia anulata]|uniref:ATP-grasp domain-containing protein n=1 Tax=Pilimelia anulata TaxID=53371 RepID=A0A8J3BF62_9ACTN|nr:MobF family relaxase [Pilimelia anulata]GGK10572.1 hypothetical protein GCM10010123_45700 [Pilimelia anulata]
MAWVTTLGPNMDQIEYRLQASGCSLERDVDGQVEYRIDGGDRPLEWVGQGLREVGIEPGAVLDDAGKDAARALADGVDPRTGQVLVAPKMAVDPRAKLPARPLVEAVAAAAQRAGVSVPKLLDDDRVAARYARAARGVTGEREGAAGSHRVPVRDLERVAAAAGIDLAEVYDGAQLAAAREHADARVVVGNRGYDLTLDLPKSYSVLVGLADEQLAAQLEDAYLAAVRETVAAVEQWAGYGLAGHHGDGRRAQRVETSGMLGWMTVHRTARPVPGAAPDPHLHAHVTLLNLVRCEDGKWRTVGAGGRDIHRHARAADAFLRTRLRETTAARWGLRWERDERTDVWEVAGVDERLRTLFSKRAQRISDEIRDAGGDQEAMTAVEQKVVAARTKEAKLPPGDGRDLRADWRAQATAAGIDPAGTAAAAAPGPGRELPARLDTDQVVAHAFRPEKGLTAHRKTATRADLLAEVMDAQPAGVPSLAAAERAADDALAHPHLVPLPPAGAVHLTNSTRFSSADVVDAERAVTAAAADRAGRGYATVAAPIVDLAIAQFEAANGFALSAEQRAVLDRVLRGGHGVDAVIGVAGAGKTTIMAAARAAFEAAGLRVAGTSTAAVAAQNLATEAGIESRTVAAWLTNIGAGRGLSGADVLVVDEAAMVDDRHLAQLLSAAGRDTKVLLIGDPLQLKAPGVGGAFAEVHRIVDGLVLAENRRQRDDVERAALAQWREGQRRQTLRAWADSGRLHVTGTAAQARQEMVAAWLDARGQWTDPHDRIGQLLMMAHRNADVDALNLAARAQLLAAGELPREGRQYRCDDGRQITLAEGDQVLIRRNDYRAGEGVDVLNGYRGRVSAVLSDGRVMVEWRRDTPDGPRLDRQWVDPDFVTSGGVTYGYAITAAKAQGLSATRSLAYGVGMDSHVLYPAMSRDRDRADLWLALQPLETDADRARHGDPVTAYDRIGRAVDAYAAALENDRPDGMVTAELDGDRVDPPADAEVALRRADVVTERARVDLAAATERIQPTDAELAAADTGRPGWVARMVAPSLGLTPQQTREARVQSLAQRIAAAEAIAAGAKPTDWQDRPYGRVVDVDQAAVDAQRLAGDAVTAAQDAAAQAARAAAAAAGDQGEAVARLRAETEQLHARAAAARQVEQERAAEQQARRDYYDANRQAARLEQQRTQNPVRLLREGTTRARLDAQITQLRADAAAHQDRAQQHQQAAQAAAEQVGHPSARYVIDQAARHDQQYPDRLRAAQAQDLTTADHATRAAGTAAADARTAIDAAGGLRAEAARRHTMPAFDRMIETVDRRQAELAQQRAERAERAAQARQLAERRARNLERDDYHRRGPDPGIDRGGPTLGL